MKVVNNTMPVISRERIFRLLGHKGNAVSVRLKKKVDKCIASIEKKMQPKVLYTTKRIRKIENGTLTLEGDVTLKSAKLSKTFKRCDKITFFLGTIGKDVDSLISASIRKKRLSEAYVYDAIGSAVVEATVEDFQNRMDSEVNKNNRSTTLRFSPGYCDWKINEQKKVFGVLENDLIGVDLNESYLMAPRKSVSGVFGIGDSRVIDKEETNPCRLCGMHKCIARRM